jgi:iron(III) transport system ATP-binding protein
VRSAEPEPRAAVTSAIELENVAVRLGGRSVIDDLSLTVVAGEVLALLGPSGCGKTTLLRLIAGFVAPDVGLVSLDGEIVSRAGKIVVPSEERGIAYVFQDLALWPHLSVQGNLAFGLEARAVAREEKERRIGEMLLRVGLEGKARRRPGDLSGGERQRVAIARALVLEPRAVLLDEPLSSLDPPLRRELLGLFRELFRERKSSAIYVTHEPREAAQIGDYFAVLEKGHIVQTGTPAELCRAPASAFVRSLLTDLTGGIVE